MMDRISAVRNVEDALAAFEEGEIDLKPPNSGSWRPSGRSRRSTRAAIAPPTASSQ
ncbi:hypothetical protein ACFQH2_02430 [Natronoarchaeum sp. GCM10025703]|uniref:DUF7854 family protein n=1 Tax=Natronoarchaeum sp. GCM10025703 TaxID=3252685 RepID=UPI00360A87BF